MQEKKIWSVLALSVVSSLLIMQSAQAERYKVRVVAVFDGDTLLVDHGGKREKIILYGIDCPESAQEFGTQAKQFTDACCSRKDVTIDLKGRDKFNRLVAEIYLSDGADLNHELVKRGLAWWSDKFAPSDMALQALQTEAKAGSTGLWAAPHPIPPWLFRNGDKAVQAKIVPSP
ncbi:thermonuclease family protein [bacterium]|nr:thermonuclease family protein [bacterium]MBP9808051.1 thermonuclease family protein [bacterium]